MKMFKELYGQTPNQLRQLNKGEWHGNGIAEMWCRFFVGTFYLCYSETDIIL
jgi:hypothetical protein